MDFPLTAENEVGAGLKQIVAGISLKEKAPPVEPGDFICAAGFMV